MIFRRLLSLPLVFALLLCAGIDACHQNDPDKAAIGATLTGVDYLPDHLGVQDFTVNGVDGAQAGKGGREVCCVLLPVKWQPGMTAKVTWNVTNFRDCTGTDYAADVPIDKYDEPGSLYVSFLPDGKVRITVSALDTPYSPGYQGPHLKIPDKHPWHVWPLHSHCPQLFK